MDSFIWLLARTEQRGSNTERLHNIQSPVPVKDGATGTAVAGTQCETQEKLPLSLALISWQDSVTNVKEGPLDQASGPTSK